MTYYILLIHMYETNTNIIHYMHISKSCGEYYNIGDSSFKKIQTAQNAALRMATGTTRWPVLTICTRSPSFRYAFCAVPCKLSGGGPHQSWHHNSRPMKETLHSRHHSTVLPRLGSNRMESHQNLHTHAGDSAIQLQGNNRVLKKRIHPNIGRGTETQPKTTMHSLTTTVRTLPSIAGLQALGVW